MMSATPEQDAAPPPPPPQPPLPLSDPAFSLPAVVHGIEPEPPAARPARDAVADALASLSARVSRAVRASRADVARAVDAVAPPPPPPRPPAVLAFGDSLTELADRAAEPAVAPGWAALLRCALRSRADVLVRGFGGYNSRWALRIFPRVLAAAALAADVKAVVVFFGANDAVSHGEPQHVPLDEYRRNLAKLVAHARAHPHGPLPVLVTPPALARARETTDDKRRAIRTASYAEACVDTGRRLGVPVVDLHAAMLGRAHGDDAVAAFLSDGLHLATDGNRLVFELLTEVFRECVPELCPDNLPPIFPHWTEIDPNDPGALLGTSSLV